MKPIQSSLLKRAVSTVILSTLTLGQILPIVPVASINKSLGTEQIADAAISPGIKARFDRCLRDYLTAGGINKLDLSQKNFYGNLPDIQEIARVKVDAWQVVVACSENGQVISKAEALQWIALFNNWEKTVWQPKFEIAKKRYINSQVKYPEVKQFVKPSLAAYEYYIDDTVKLAQDIFARPVAKFTTAYDQRTNAFKSRFFHNSDAYQAYWAWNFAIILAQAIQNKDMRFVSELEVGLSQVSPKQFDPNAPLLQSVSAAYNLGEAGSPFNMPFSFTPEGGSQMQNAVQAHQAKFWNSKVKPRMLTLANNSMYRLSKMGCAPESCMKFRDLLADLIGIVGLPGEGIFPNYNAARLATRVPVKVPKASVKAPARSGSGISGVLDDGARVVKKPKAPTTKRPSTNNPADDARSSNRNRTRNNPADDAKKRPSLECVAFNPNNEKIEFSLALNKTITKSKSLIAQVLAESNAKVVSDAPIVADSEFAPEFNGELEFVSTCTPVQRQLLNDIDAQIDAIASQHPAIKAEKLKHVARGDFGGSRTSGMHHIETLEVLRSAGLVDVLSGNGKRITGSFSQIRRMAARGEALKVKFRGSSISVKKSFFPEDFSIADIAEVGEIIANNLKNGVEKSGRINKVDYYDITHNGVELKVGFYHSGTLVKSWFPIK